MRLRTLFKAIAPAAAMAMGAAMSGCSNNTNFGGMGDGVPLAELDMAGAAPTEFVLAGPDNIILTESNTLSIEVEGDAKVTDLLRFKLDGDSLAVSREKSDWNTKGTATVRIGMPAPTSIAISGSGSVEAASLSTNPELNIAGSGSLKINEIAAERLEVNIAGSGSVEGRGTAQRLEINVAGSGDADFSDLQTERAEANIMGSGDTRFSSDGTVEANIAGSGDVRVYGRAKCTVSAMGSGSVTCEMRKGDASAEQATAGS